MLSLLFLSVIVSFAIASGCIKDSEPCKPSFNYFEDIHFDQGEHVTFTSFLTYLEMNITHPGERDPWHPVPRKFRYVLVHCGCPEPKGYPATVPIIHVPIADLGSSVLETYPMLHLLKKTRLLTIMTDDRYVTTQSVIDYVQERFQKKNPIPMIEQHDDASGRTVISVDVLQKVNPEVMLVDLSTIEQIGGQFKNLFYWGSMDESDPSARVEWIEVLALLTGVTGSEEIDRKIKSEYEWVKSLVPVNVTNPPKVFMGVFWNFTYNGQRIEGFNVPGGQSYRAQLIRDAGGDYFADKTNHTSLFLNYTYGISLLGKADYWILPNVCYRRVEEFLGYIPALGNTNVLREGHVLLAHRRADDDLCLKNDATEGGLIYPGYVLRDIVKLMWNRRVFSRNHTQYITTILPKTPGSAVRWDDPSTYPTNCQYQGWGGWTACSADCGEGIKYRVRNIKTLPMRGGATCNTMFDYRDCQGACKANFNLTVFIICICVIAAIVAIGLTFYCARRTAKNIGTTLQYLQDDEKAVVIAQLAQGNYQTIA